jgi:predicted ATP-binding protein involved in virulence
MKILRFEAEKLHRYLSFAFDLKPDLVFLTGINGSGKTSAVRSISSLLAPSLLSLVDMEYSRIAVTVDDGNEKLTISSSHRDEDLILRCSNTSDQLKIPIIRREPNELLARYSSRKRDFYNEQEAINSDSETLSIIKKLPTPMYLDLERRYQVGPLAKRGLGGTSNRAVPRAALPGTTQDGLRAAINLADEVYREYFDAQSTATETLKQDIVLAAFQPSKTSILGGPFAPESKEMKDIIQRIEHHEKVLPSVLSQIGISDERIRSLVLPFLAKARTTISNAPTSEQLRNPKSITKEVIQALQEWSAIFPQFLNIDKLVELIDSYTVELNRLYSPIKKYLDSVNEFLAESRKNVFIDSSGTLLVSFGDGIEPRSIYSLSSGERQMVVILTHLALSKNAKLANVLIIDEPELSLHLHWQELFVDAVMKASPGIQLILATHSPAIIGGRLDNCIDIAEARQNDSLFS